MKRLLTWSRLSTALLLIAPLSLTGCATGPASNASKPQTNVCKLIPLPTYSTAFDQALADEISAAAPGAKFPDVIQGCMLTRDAVRACATAP